METNRNNKPPYISDDEVKKLLAWPSVFEACEQALRSVSKTKTSENQPTAIQPARQIIRLNDNSGIVLSMLGVINNYRLPSVDSSRTFDTIGHKLVTYYARNQELVPPLSNILATIALYDTATGKLRGIVEGTEITAWRTAASSLVATKYLYFDRISDTTSTDSELSIIGCGAQGRIHAIAMCSTFNISTVNLWNRTKVKATTLAVELEDLKSSFRNKSLRIIVHDTVDNCVAQSDIIVTATNTPTPLLFANALKANVHVNAVGAGVNHHSEIDGSVYEKSKIYVDSWASAETELKTLNYPIVGEVGEIINGVINTPNGPLTIYQSMGIAVLDAVVGELVMELYAKGDMAKENVLLKVE